MYEFIIQWGLQSLTSLSTASGQHQQALMIEALRARNGLIHERFGFAWEACQAVVDTAEQMEGELAAFSEASRETDGSLDGAKRFVGDLQRELAPKYYRQFRQARSRFDATNDLIAAYSKALEVVVHIDWTKDVYKAKQLYSRSGIVRLYRGQWSLLAAMLMSLLRVSSSDLRFWATDRPYVDFAFAWADRDVEAVKHYLLAGPGAGIFRLSLERPGGPSQFWDAYDAIGE